MQKPKWKKTRNLLFFEPNTLAQTPGPDLACQYAVMESEAFISSENSCICTSRRTRADWLGKPEFYGFRFPIIAATSEASGQVALSHRLAARRAYSSERA